MHRRKVSSSDNQGTNIVTDFWTTPEERKACYLCLQWRPFICFFYFLFEDGILMLKILIDYLKVCRLKTDTN